MTNIFDITTLGAVADGKTDCTMAIQKAIDIAEKLQGEVFIPSGEYLTGKLYLRPYVKISGINTRSYRNNGGSILKLNDEKVNCMLDLSVAYGCHIEGICLDGGCLGENIHGILTDREDDAELQEEDSFVIDNVKISNFSGDGLHLQRIWCFSLRHSMIYKNRGNGLYVFGWDGFIIDNWFSYNEGAGVYSDKEISAVLFNANRVEWNKVAGFKFINPISVNIVGNAFDASGGPGLDLKNDKGQRAINMTVTGNSFSRSGLICNRNEHSGKECHLHIERGMNLVVIGNVFYEGFDDNGNREYLSPKAALVIKKLENCTIKDNIFDKSATEQIIEDYGEHLAGNIIQIFGNARPKADGYLFPFFDD